MKFKWTGSNPYLFSVTDLNLFAEIAQHYVLFFAHECRKFSFFSYPSYNYVSGFVSEARKNFRKRHLKILDSSPDPQTIIGLGFLSFILLSPFLYIACSFRSFHLFNFCFICILGRRGLSWPSLSMPWPPPGARYQNFTQKYLLWLFPPLIYQRWKSQSIKIHRL